MKFIKIIIIISIIFSLSSNLNAQELITGYGVNSINAWGSIDKAKAFKIEYMHNVYEEEGFIVNTGIKIHQIMINESVIYTKKIGRANVTDIRTIKGDFRALFLMGQTKFNDVILGINLSQKIGTGYFFKKFADSYGSHVNFSISQAISKEIINKVSIEIEYNHISNGNLGPINPGIDNIFININLQL